MLEQMDRQLEAERLDEDDRGAVERIKANKHPNIIVEATNKLAEAIDNEEVVNSQVSS
jgi:hypothetical protein